MPLEENQRKNKIEGGIRVQGTRKNIRPGQPLVTIVTVVRNAREAIRATIESVINQTYENIEYIVIDGNSDDGTVDVIRGYEEHIDYWLSETDGSPYEAMNKAIDLASGEWINFMNSGDHFYNADVVREIVAQFSRDNDFVYGHYIYGDNAIPTKAVDFDILWQQLRSNMINRAWMYGFPCHQALFSRTDVLKRYKYSLNYKFAAEQDTLLHAYLDNHKCLRLDIVVAHYAGGGISFKHQVRSLIERWRILKKIQGGITLNLFFLRRILRVLVRRLLARKKNIDIPHINDFSEGWYPLETNFSGWWYWTDKRGVVTFTSDDENEYYIKMELISFKQPNTVDIYLNSQLIASVDITWRGFKKYNPIPLKNVKGTNKIVFISREDPVTTIIDGRSLAIGVKNMKIERDG